MFLSFCIFPKFEEWFANCFDSFNILNIINIINSPPIFWLCLSLFFGNAMFTVRFIKKYVIGESHRTFHETNILKCLDRLIASQSRGKTKQRWNHRRRIHSRRREFPRASRSTLLVAYCDAIDQASSFSIQRKGIATGGRRSVFPTEFRHCPR